MALLAEPTGRVLRVVEQPGATLLVTDDGDVCVSAVPARAAARMVLAGVRHASWVRIDVDGGRVVGARFAGATRVPVVREIAPGAALSLAAGGVPAFVRRVGR